MAIEDGTGRGWTLSGATAWDATGASLASSLGVVGQALVLRVEVDGAVLPVTLDPLVTTPSTILNCLARGPWLARGRSWGRRRP